MFRSYRYPLELPEHARTFLKLEQPYAGSLAKVSFDGVCRGYLLGAPLEMELNANGSGLLEIEVFGSRRNSFGPLHLCNWSHAGAAPWEFNPDPFRYTPNPVLVPNGLMGAPLLLVEAGVPACAPAAEASPSACAP